MIYSRQDSTLANGLHSRYISGRCAILNPRGFTIMRKHLQTGPLDVLLSREEGKYYAHCLPFDLLAEGDTEDQAKKRLEEMIFEYIRFFMEKNLEPFLFRPAPMKYWDILRMIRTKARFFPRVPDGLLRASSPNRIAPFLNSVNAPACS